MYAYLQLGQDGAAQELLDEINAIEQLDVANFAAAYALTAMPARYALERGEWAEASCIDFTSGELGLGALPTSRSGVGLCPWSGCSPQR